MPLLHLVVLALVQGLTEFIPVSSSAHLILPAQLIEEFEDQGTGIDVAAHVGSLGAVILYFRREVADLSRGARQVAGGRVDQEGRMLLLILAATVPFLVAATALALSGYADALRSPVVIAWASIGFGVLLWVADRVPQRIAQLPDRFGPAVLIGLAQCFALVPGTSRSGITMTAARFMGYDRTEAARFSMLLSIPTIAATGLYLATELGEAGSTPWSAALLVAALSFVAAYVAIDLFLRLTRSVSYTPFVVYRIALGIVLLVMFA